MNFNHSMTSRREFQLEFRSTMVVRQSDVAASKNCGCLALYAFFFVAVCAVSPSTADDEAEERTHLRLYAFCKSAILWDRGLTNNMRGLGTDAWIVKELVPDEKFREVLAQLPPPAANESDIDVEALRQDDPIEQLYLRSIPSVRQVLESKLGKVEHRKLIYVYIQLEGLMALCRPEFSSLFDDPSARQKHIREIFVKAWTEQAAAAHQALFVMDGDSIEEAPTYIAFLRQVSSAADCRALELLTPVEKSRLLQIVRTSEKLRTIIRSPGAN